MSIRTVILLIAWIAAFAGALAADSSIAAYSREHGWEKPGGHHAERSSPTDLPRPGWSSGTQRIAEILKFPGTMYATAVIAVAVLLLHREHGFAAAVMGLAGLLSGVNSLLKWIAGRHRPVTGADPFDLHPFAGGFAGLFGAEPNLSFPSGHACTAFANAAALAILLPRWRWLFYAIATATAVERVVENAHFASDAVAGAAIGILCARVAYLIVALIRKQRAAVAIPAAAN